MVEKGEQFDTIVVGAGLAGLSAAFESGLRNKRVLVLEAADQPGGKVITRRWNDIVYECGALFAIGQDGLPFPIETGGLISEDHPIGVLANGRVVAGDSVLTCLQSIGMGTREAFLLKHFLESESPQPGMIGEEINAVLDAFFQVIHPGALADYVPARRRDSLARHNIAHFENGNAAIVEAFIEHSAAEIRTGCRVTRVCPDRDAVAVHWSTNHGMHSARSDGVVLATPARQAKQLLAEQASAARVFLDTIRYGKGIAVVVGLGDTSLQLYSYVVAPAGPVNTFLFHHHTRTPGIITVTAYLVAERAETAWGKGDDELVELVRAQLNALNIGAVTPGSVIFSDVYRWDAIGPIISDETYGRFSEMCLRPCDRVVLAGDYTWWDKQQMPYGTHAAIASGKRAAEMLSDAAASTVTSYFQPEPLATSLISVLTERGPEVRGRVEDGTIAYYGLRLQSDPDIELEHYLLAEAEDGLWSYQRGYGVTSLDSALVMEGLLATGRHTQLLNHSAERLVAEFFDRVEGGFQTIPHSRQGRAPYWHGTDCPATAFCAWLLAQIAPDRYREQIEACADYLRRKQKITGGWSGKWFPSETIPLFYAVRLLAPMGAECAKSCQRARLWLWGRQRKDGSWLGSVIESSAAILALCILGGSADQIRKGSDWITTRRIGPGWAGEPILQYWFDEDGEKTLFNTSDKGQITTSWARIALREAEGLLAK